jgi:hypothetical protein
MNTELRPKPQVSNPVAQTADVASAGGVCRSLLPGRHHKSVLRDLLGLAGDGTVGGDVWLSSDTDRPC